MRVETKARTNLHFGRTRRRGLLHGAPRVPLVSALAIAVACLLLASRAPASLPFLTARGTQICDPTGRPVALCGTNLAGGFLYERWLAEMPGPEGELPLWRLLTKRFGETRCRQLQRVWRTNWISDDDITACARMGMTCLRLPFGYWIVEDSTKPGALSPEGFAEIERVIDACEKCAVYLVLDLHGAPGGQCNNQFCGEPDRNELWGNEEYLQRTVSIWREIARRCKGRAVVAGYDLLNEPIGAPGIDELITLYDRIYRAIREVDPDHLIFLEDGYKGFASFPLPSDRGWQNVVYSPHFYTFGYRKPHQHQRLMAALRGFHTAQHARLKLPVWVGEFSAVSFENGGPDMYRAYINLLNELGWGWATFCWKHPCPRPSKDLWGIVNQPRGGEWQPPDPFNDSFPDLIRKFQTFHLRFWDYSPHVRPVIADGLKAPFPALTPSAR